MIKGRRPSTAAQHLRTSPKSGGWKLLERRHAHLLHDGPITRVGMQGIQVWTVLHVDELRIALLKCLLQVIASFLSPAPAATSAICNGEAYSFAALRFKLRRNAKLTARKPPLRYARSTSVTATSSPSITDSLHCRAARQQGTVPACRPLPTERGIPVRKMIRRMSGVFGVVLMATFFALNTNAQCGASDGPATSAAATNLLMRSASLRIASHISFRLGVRPKIDFLRTDPTREVIHIGLSGTVGVV